MRPRSPHLSGVVPTHWRSGGDRLTTSRSGGTPQPHHTRHRRRLCRLARHLERISWRCAALLGHRLGGWRLALQVVAVGAVLPGVARRRHCACAYSHSTSRCWQPSRAHERAVWRSFGAAIRLLKPQLVTHPHTLASRSSASPFWSWALSRKPICRHAAGRWSLRRHMASFRIIMTALALCWLFLRAIALSFSGFATVPILRESLSAGSRTADGRAVE